MNWDWFQLSFHSIGVFIATIILVIESWILIIKKDKTRPTYWLIGLYIGFGVMFIGYFCAYSIYHPLAAFHRYLTICTMFGEASLIGFAYYFPRNEYPKEAKVMVPFAFVLAIGGFIHFVFNTYKMENFYNFEAHFYSFDFGAQTGIIILIQFIIPLVILARKTIKYSEYDGKLKKWLIKPGQSTFGFKIVHYFSKFIVGWIKFLFPKGKDAKATRTFFIAFLLLIITAVTNVLNKNGILSYDYYAIYYSNSSLIITFVLLMAYINSSGEPTTFMVKLVGISLITVLMVIGFISNITLYLSEADYDNQKIAQVTSSKNYILSANYVELSDDIRYIVKKPKDINLFDRKLELMYVAQGEKLDQEIVNESEKTFSASLINENLTKLIKKNPTASVEELKLIAIEEYKKSRKYNNLITDLNLEKFRHYRAAGNHYTFFDMIHGEDRYEIGFSYKEYRVHTHKNALKLFILSIVTTILILVLFPKFFEASLVKPLNSLLRGVHKVNLGNLNVEVHIQVQDEIGFISSSFNSMVASIKQAKQELQDYANTLEDKVQERTKEVQDKMQEVQALKVQQDGDYFLTSLLTKPLFINASKSEVVKTEFLIRQKKRFEFRNKSSELGGDICITGNLKLGTPQKFRRYTMAMNGDAMGKSMQGAGGSLVMGVVMNSIMARSASNKRILDTTPEQWLTDAYHECNSIFKSFNGTMVLSATVALIDDMTGMMHYWNAEHPFTILYRDEKAGFLEESLQLRKLGLESEYEFKVHTFKLMPGDVVLLASDGRDDIDLTPEESFRTINDDEFMILGIVEQAKGNVEHIETILKSKGTITDDLSMLKIIYNATGATLNTDDESIPGAENEKISSISTLPDVSEAYLLGRELYQEGKIVESLEILKSAYSTNDTNSKLNKLLGLICFKSKDYNQAVNVFSKYLTEDNNSEEIWYYLSLAQKRIGSYFTSLESSRKVYELNPSNVNNLVNLSDLYRISGNSLNARIFSEKALIIDKENKNALKILSILEKT